ncbi:hypothetical protein [Shimia ponticola]|uniref:hypothetical protein n=1 Tax=Shimia ponticola TaxID=2582893 RepID=UPI0011BD7FD5|nr:hypothetical protein [Shimia ponticola]
MQNPSAIHLTTTAEVKEQGWIAEARDSDGHLVSTLAWVDTETKNEGLQAIGDFISDWTPDMTVNVFKDRLILKLA